ncbi:hypothetical protein [Demequina litorisediminis]|uniref:hypothetical protein n=1 Tax=Demequina litorisediminis TaxID=1849022 RepID=UPI0024E0E776|nr:hypothetical protein [Demequina litorisediminis]
MAAMLTAAGLRTTRRVLSISWPFVWIAAAVAVISGIVTLPAAITVVLIGRASGLMLRWAVGSTADRAYGAALADGIRRAGFEPRRIVRADHRDSNVPDTHDDVAAAIGRTRSGRIYSVTTIEGHQAHRARDGRRPAHGRLPRKVVADHPLPRDRPPRRGQPAPRRRVDRTRVPRCPQRRGAHRPRARHESGPRLDARGLPTSRRDASALGDVRRRGRRRDAGLDLGPVRPGPCRGHLAPPDLRRHHPGG